eukprot:m.1179574 g.1179574  ORF g.1179574 m.1179574 type:complete len:59 (+) comp24529_c0_seq49:334-510(+)
MGTPVPQQCHHPYLFNTHLLLELFYLMSTLAITKLITLWPPDPLQVTRSMQSQCLLPG